MRKEYRTTYFTFDGNGECSPREGLTPLAPRGSEDGDPSKWVLIGTSAATYPDNPHRLTVLWTWQREEWWEPKGQQSGGGPQ